MTDLYDHDTPVTDLGIDVPAWIEQDITCADVAALLQGGCASGSYMPAVTYHQALATMSDHGDDVLAYIDATLGLSEFRSDEQSWSGLACDYLSTAVELWASSVENEIEDALEELEEETD